MLILQAALSYADRGWHVLPLRPKSKIPSLQAWQQFASKEAEQVERFWAEQPGANVGVQLGPRSGIIDVEYDTDEGKATAARILGECFTPTFSSGSRSVHRLFRWTGDLPDQQVLKIKGLEIRIGGGGKGAQSVFPPSVHPSGAVYQWEPGLSPDDVDPIDLPDSLHLMLINDPAGEGLQSSGKEARDPEHWERINEGVSEGGRNDAMASWIGKQLSDIKTQSLERSSSVRNVLAAAFAINDKFTPPLDTEEVEKIFMSILRRERQRRITDEIESQVQEPIDDAVQAKPARGRGITWKIVVIKSDPTMYELHAPEFIHAQDKKLILTADQICSGSAIRVQAAKQAYFPLPRNFSKAWELRPQPTEPSLYERLMNAAEHIDAPPEEKRYLFIAEMLQAFVRSPKQIEADQEPEQNHACQLPTGQILFVFSKAWARLNVIDKVARPELSGILKRIGATWHRHGDMRFKCLTIEAQGKLRQMLEEHTEK